MDFHFFHYHHDHKAEKKDSSAESFSRESIVILIMTFVTYMGFYFPQPMLATIAQYFQITPDTSGLIITVVIAPFAIGPFVYGRVLRLVSVRQLLCILAAVQSISLILPFVYTSFPLLLGCRLCQGLALPGMLMCLTTQLSLRCTGSVLQRVMALYSTAAMLGAFVGRIFTSYLSLQIGWNGTFLVMGAVLGTAIVPLFLFVKDVEGKANTAYFSLKDIISVFASRKLLLVILVAPLCIFCNSSVLNILPFYLKNAAPGISDSLIGFTFAGGIIGSFAGIASKQIIHLLKSEWNVILAGIILIGISVQMLFLQGIFTAVAVILGVSLGFSLMNSTILGVLNRVTHLSKSLTNSVFLSVYYIVGTVGTYVPLRVYIGQGLLMYDLLVMAAIGAALVIVYYLKGHVDLNKAG